MPTRPATPVELEGHDGQSISEIPFWERLMSEYLVIGEINGWEEIDMGETNFVDAAE